MTGQDERHYDYAGEAVRWLAAGFGLGMLIGGALGILLAPKPGSETREQLKEIATDLSERARTVASDLSTKATATYGDVSERARTSSTDVGGRMRTVAKDLGGKVAEAKIAGTRAYEAVKEGYKKTVEELGTEEKAVADEGDIEVEVDIEPTDEQ